MRVDADIEASGLIDYKKLNIYPEHIWCAVIRDIDTGIVYKFVPPEYENHAKGWVSLDRLAKWSERVTEWWGHNFLSYDAAVLNALCGTKITPDQVHDTLIMSKMRGVNRVGGHSLAALGSALGYKKIVFDDWSKFSEQQLNYCVQDVVVTGAVRRDVVKDLEGWSEQSIRLEHKVRFLFDKQQKNGFYLDELLARSIYGECKAEADVIELDLNDSFTPRAVADTDFTPRVTKTGNIAKNSTGGMPLDNCRVGAKFIRLNWKPFNIKSPKEKLIRLEPWWKPTVKTKTGKSWQLCEENLLTLPLEAPQGLKDLAKWAILTSRCNNIWKEPKKGKPHASWLGNLGEDGRVHPYQDNLGAYTQRSSHRGPNIAGVPGVNDKQGRPAIKGKECRQCWTVKDTTTHCIVGTDASGMQLRALAHYINLPEYIQATIEGDIHTDNMNNLNSGGKVVCKARPYAKTFIYAWLMGCAAYKVSLILGCSLKQATAAMKSFIANTPGLEDFIYRKKMASQRGYMMGLDGRRIPIPSEFLAMPCYLQGFESVIMKLANVYWDNMLNKNDIFFLQCANVHDEWQTEALLSDIEDIFQYHAENKKEAEKIMPDSKRIYSAPRHVKDDLWERVLHPVGETQVKAIIQAGIHLKSNCPLDGEYKVGQSWKDTH